MEHRILVQASHGMHNRLLPSHKGEHSIVAKAILIATAKNSRTNDYLLFMRLCKVKRLYFCTLYFFLDGQNWGFKNLFVHAMSFKLAPTINQYTIEQIKEK
jgi:hypothetical protein